MTPVPRMLTEATGKFAYQLIGEEYVATREGAMLMWGFSTGKSRVVFTRLVRDERILYTLMFCRLDNIDTLKKELEKHTTLHVVELLGANADVRTVVAAYSSTLRTQRAKTVFLVNYAKARYLGDELISLKCDAVLADESTCIKAWSAKQAQEACRVAHAPGVVFRCVMAGDMAPQGIENYWSQFYFADKGVTFGRSYWSFLNTYFSKMGYEWVLKPGARDTIIEKISKVASIMPTSDTRIPLRVNPVLKVLKPTAEQASMLAQLTEGKLITPRGLWVLPNQAVAFEKMLQVTGGYVRWPDEPEGDGAIHLLESNPKLEALEQMLECELADRLKPGNPKIVIIASHHAEMKMISGLLLKHGVTHCGLHGQNSPAVNAQSKDAFLKDTNVRVMVGQADMFIGLNELIVADTMIWYSNSHKADSRAQAEARLDRPGQTAGILNHIDLVIHDEVDEGVYHAVGVLRMDASGVKLTAFLKQRKKAG